MYTIRPIRKIIQFFVDKPLKKDAVLNKRYQINRILGLGSFGIVYKCEDQLLIKQYLLNNSDQAEGKTEKSITFLKQEAKILQYLNHESIPTFIETFSIEDQLFYVMDFIKGGKYSI